MHIKEIVLEGFKSYAKRTVIAGFDSHFNAITGFNGSGKSNILDAICFVLGITNLTTVRVTSLQELIYKNGQAGVTKANVTILFDNSDKSRSHEVYKERDTISVRREIAVGGTTKYTINGTKATGEKVKQLFCMAGLNVNNANFLIMQGRITQVTGMKPKEILSLVEETAGINIYESERRKAENLMQKKDLKLAEIDKILNEDVNPMLERLQKEKEDYLIWKSKKDETEELEKKLLIVEYYNCLEKCQQNKDITEDYLKQLKKAEEKKEKTNQKLEELKKQETETLGTSDTSNKLNEELEKAKNEINQEKANLDSKQKELKETTQEIQTQEKELLENSTNQKRLAQKIQYLESNKQRKEQQVSEKLSQLENLKTSLQALEQGIETENFTESIVNSKQRELSKTKQEIQSLQKKIKNTNEFLSSKQKKLQEAKSSSVNEEQAVEKLKQEISALERFIQEGQQANPQKSTLGTQIRNIQTEIQDLERQLRDPEYSRFKLSYQDPEPNFNRSKVKGRIIHLIKVKDFKYSKALDVGAGSGLFGLVVDTDTTGQLLLKRKTFGNVRIFANNRMKPFEVNPNIEMRIKQTYGDRVFRGLDLIEYQPEFYNSVGYIFGGFYVCENTEIAKRVAYEFKQKAITLEGDVYDPSGVISGGASRQSQSYLELYKKLVEIQNRYESLKENHRKLSKELEAYRETDRKLMEMQNELQIKAQTLKAKESFLREGNAQRFSEEINQLENELENLNIQLEEYQRSYQAIEEDLRSIQAEPKSNSKESLSKALNKTQEEYNCISQELKTLKQELEESKVKLSSLEETTNDLSEDLSQNKQNVDKLEHEIQNLTESIKAKDSVYQEKKNEYETLREEENRNHQKLKEIKEEISKQNEYLKHTKKEIEDLERKLKHMKEDSKKAKEDSKKIIEENKWILEAEMEIPDIDTELEKQKLDKLKYECEQEKKRINTKVMSTLDDQEQRYTELVEKRSIVLSDKSKLQEVIQELDSKKQECIINTWEAVDLNLQRIFQSILPGATAALGPVYHKEDNSLVGLELKVAFGNVWKTNLSELSGGQRSLLALSFILSLLKYKPAPIYILDEIDAALDMSHTQNIGKMVKEHFSESQFIVVSLKEGMFTNANVLFKTQFLEGRSIVERRALCKNSADEQLRSRKLYN